MSQQLRGSRGGLFHVPTREVRYIEKMSIPGDMDSLGEMEYAPGSQGGDTGTEVAENFPFFIVP